MAACRIGRGAGRSRPRVTPAAAGESGPSTRDNGFFAVRAAAGPVSRSGIQRICAAGHPRRICGDARVAESGRTRLREARCMAGTVTRGNRGRCAPGDDQRNGQAGQFTTPQPHPAVPQVDLRAARLGRCRGTTRRGCTGNSRCGSDPDPDHGRRRVRPGTGDGGCCPGLRNSLASGALRRKGSSAGGVDLASR